jgi:cytochrome c oxidase cbb3-type subunit I/II
LTRKLNYKDLPQRMKALRWLGAPYADEEIANAEALAKAQSQRIADDIAKQHGPAGLADTQAVAMVAYLQMLGTGLRPPPDQPPAPSAPPPAPAKPIAAGGAAGAKVAAAEGGPR